MPRDTDEELRRLEQALLDEEAEIDEEEDAREEDIPEFTPEEDPYIPNAGVYQNYSNDYGKNLRNYASGYRAYNADKTDVDLEDYTQDVREEQQSSGLLWFLVVLLVVLIGVVCAVLWKYLGGIL